jgi:hypothetical protein
MLLVTLGRNLADASGTPFTTLLTMFLVAYMGYFATSLMFANIPHSTPTSGFDASGAAYAAAAVPLFHGARRLAELTGWLLIGAAVGGYGLFAQHLHRSGYVSGGSWMMRASRLTFNPLKTSKLIRKCVRSPSC